MQTAKFKTLVEKYLDESIRPEERQELAVMLQDPANLSILDEMVLTLLANRTYALEPVQAIQDSINQYLDKKIQSVNGLAVTDIPESVETGPAAKEISLHRSLFLRRWGWAAAAIVVAGIAGYLWTNFREKSQTIVKTTGKVPANDIAPGNNRAILTLSDGTTLLLDSVANGAIARQDNAAIIKLSNGQIAYQAQGKATNKTMMNTMSTPRGGQYQLTLPDGSKVWLNAASSISYPASFAGRERRVKVAGEVYFEVAKNKAKPFIVDIDGRSTVEVLGTHFNINSYKDEAGVRTTLLEGSVKVSTTHKTVLLQPGQQAAITGTDPTPVVRSDIDVVRTVAWKNGLFVFDDDDIKSIMRQISRWYDIEIVYNDPPLNKLFMGKIPRDVPVSMVLELLELTGQVHFAIEGKKIIVNR